MTDPEPPKPEGVRLLDAKGRAYPVEVTYVGVDAVSGIHEWSVPERLPKGGDWSITPRFEIDMLPPMTGIAFPLGAYPPGEPADPEEEPDDA